jgi:quercetin dioxygenase-like cupin family protein
LEQAISTNWRPFIRTGEDAAATLADRELKAITHSSGEASPVHTHAEDHIIFIRSGRMRCTVDGDSLDAVAGDTIITPEGVPHAFEVLDDKPSQVVCVVCPPASTGR